MGTVAGPWPAVRAAVGARVGVIEGVLATGTAVSGAVACPARGWVQAARPGPWDVGVWVLIVAPVLSAIWWLSSSLCRGVSGPRWAARPLGTPTARRGHRSVKAVGPPAPPASSPPPSGGDRGMPATRRVMDTGGHCCIEPSRVAGAGSLPARCLPTAPKAAHGACMSSGRCSSTGVEARWSARSAVGAALLDDGLDCLWVATAGLSSHARFRPVGPGVVACREEDGQRDWHAAVPLGRWPRG